MDIAEAARILGISPAGVRKRLERGQIAGRKVGGRWDVALGADATANATEQDEPRQRDRTRQRDNATGQDVSALVAERDWLRGRVEELTALLAREQELRLRESPPVQLAPVDVSASDTGPVVPVRAPESPEFQPAATASSTDSTPAAKRRPWWRRLVGG